MRWPHLLPLQTLTLAALTTANPVHHLTHQTVLTTTSTIRDELLASKIIPQVLNDFEPTYYIDLAYPHHHSQVLLGNTLPVRNVSSRPVFSFHALTPPNDDAPNEKNLTFTLVLTDPDALSYDHPSKSEMCHWIVTNLTTPLGFDTFSESVSRDVFEDGIAMLEHLLDDGQDEATSAHTDKKKDKKKKKKQHQPKKLANEVEAYLPPAPPKKTGPHRYVFVLLEGDASHLVAPKERAHWGFGKERHGIRDWSRENNLTVVGVNFFMAQNEKQKKKKHH